jgi:hypothetical protein
MGELSRMREQEFVRRELARLGPFPDPPECCPKCGGELREGQGMVGEMVLYCPNKKCDQGIAWEDSEGAIRRVI